MAMIKEKKGFFFTVLMIVLVSFMIASVSIWSQVNEAKDARYPDKISARSMKRLLEQVSEERLGVFVNESAFFALHKLDAHLRGYRYDVDGIYLRTEEPILLEDYEDINETMYELIMYGNSTDDESIDFGTLEYSEDETKRYTLVNGWNGTMSDVSETMGFEFDLKEVNNFSFEQVDAWNVKVSYDIVVTIRSREREMTLEEKSFSLESEFPITGYEDPMVAYWDYMTRVSKGDNPADYSRVIEKQIFKGIYNTTEDIAPQRAGHPIVAHHARGRGWIYGVLTKSRSEMVDNREGDLRNESMRLWYGTAQEFGDANITGYEGFVITTPPYTTVEYADTVSSTPGNTCLYNTTINFREWQENEDESCEDICDDKKETCENTHCGGSSCAQCDDEYELCVRTIIDDGGGVNDDFEDVGVPYYDPNGGMECPGLVYVTEYETVDIEGDHTFSCDWYFVDENTSQCFDCYQWTPGCAFDCTAASGVWNNTDDAGGKEAYLDRKAAATPIEQDFVYGGTEPINDSHVAREKEFFGRVGGRTTEESDIIYMHFRDDPSSFAEEGDRRLFIFLDDEEKPINTVNESGIEQWLEEEAPPAFNESTPTYPSGSTSIQPKEMLEVWDIENFRDAVASALYVQSDKAPSFLERFVEGGIDKENATMGIEGFTVGRWAGADEDGDEVPLEDDKRFGENDNLSEEERNEFSRIDHEFFGEEDGILVRGMPGCKSKFMCNNTEYPSAIGNFRINENRENDFDTTTKGGIADIWCERGENEVAGCAE